MLSPALLKNSMTRRSFSHHSTHSDENQQGMYVRRRSNGLIEIDEEPRTSDCRRPSLFLVADLPTHEITRRHSSGSDKRKRSKSSVREDRMFSKSSNFFGTSSIIKEQAAAREAERQRMRRLSNMARRESLAAGPKANAEHENEVVVSLIAKLEVSIHECGMIIFVNVHVNIWWLQQVSTHQYTEDPTLAWEMLKEKRPVKPVRQMKLDTPVKIDHVRFVCLGCTHGNRIDPSRVPPGDVLLIAGDFTTCGLPKEVHSFNKNLSHFKHAYKVIIAGNHECTFDDSFLKSSNREIEAKEMALKQALQASLASTKLSSPKPLLTNAIYLEDSVIELFGITIYGSPWQPRVDNWAFNLSRGQPLLDKWNLIPAGVDVLLTHTPPLGHGDMMISGQRMGCVELLNSVCKRVKPKYHVFSHIHEGYGCTSDGYTKFINCCICNGNLEMKNDPIIFDIPVHPHTKQFYLQNVKKIMKRFLKTDKK